MKILVMAATIGTVLAGPAVSLARATYSAEYSGTVSSGYDLTGLFGAPDTSLTGDGYTEVFTIDTTKGELATSPTSEEVDGGSAEDLSSPVLVTLTINGITQTVGGGFFSIADTGLFNGSYQINDTVEDISDDGGLSIANLVQESLVSSTPGVANGIPTAFGDYSLVVNGTTIVNAASSSFDFETTNAAGEYVVYADGTLNPVSATSGVSAAPEPATWALMIIGISGIGYAFRRAKKDHGFTLSHTLSA